jgi:hypothetical protein
VKLGSHLAVSNLYERVLFRVSIFGMWINDAHIPVANFHGFCRQSDAETDADSL